MNQAWENGKKPNFVLSFAPLSFPQLFLDFTFTGSWTLFQTIILCNFKEHWWTKLEKMTKNLILGPQNYFPGI